MPLTIGQRKKLAPLLSPSFKWHSAATHSTPDAFRERQKERMAKAQKERRA